MLNREPMWLKSFGLFLAAVVAYLVSVLNREPMWLKFGQFCRVYSTVS